MSQTFFLCALFFFLISNAYAQSGIPTNKSVVYGPGLVGGSAGDFLFIFINPVDGNGTQINNCGFVFNVTVMQGNTPYQVITSCLSDGTYAFYYKGKTAGNYMIYVQYGSIVLGQSPYSALITAGSIYYGSSIASGSGINGGTVGTLQCFNIYAFDAYGNANQSCDPVFSVFLTGPSNVSGVIMNCSAGVYAACYSTQKSGRYNINVFLSNTYPIENSPYKMTMNPGAIYAGSCIASGAGASAAIAGDQTRVIIIAEDQYANVITTCYGNLPYPDWFVYLMNGQTQVNATVTDCVNGQYYAQYTVTKATIWSLYVLFKGSNIANVPYAVNVSAALNISPANSVATGIGITSGTAGNSTQINLIPYDQYDNRIYTCAAGNTSAWTIALTAVNDPTVTCSGSVSGCSAGTYFGQYSCTNATQYNLYIFYQGQQLTATYRPTLKPAALSAPNSIASGAGLFNAQAGVPSVFTIAAFDQYNNKIHQCISPLSNSFVILVQGNPGGPNIKGQITNCTDGYYLGTYTVINLSYVYILTITYGNQAVAGSPFYFSATAGPPSNCIATGLGLTNAQAGEWGNFSLTCKDSYSNPIYNCYENQLSFWNLLLYPITAVTVNNKPVIGSAFSCSNKTSVAQTFFHYNATKSGYYNLTVGFSNSPGFFFSKPFVAPGVFDSKNSGAYGPGVGFPVNAYGPLIAGNTAYFYVIAQDKWGNNVTTCLTPGGLTVTVTSNNNTNVNPTIGTCDNSTGVGITQVSWYYPRSGVYIVHVYYKGQELANSPYKPKMVAGPISPGQSYATGSGLVGTVAGVVAPINIIVFDKYSNRVTQCLSPSLYSSLWAIALQGPVSLIGNITACLNNNNTGPTSYRAQYYGVVAGNYTMTISYSSVNIQSNPYFPVITPAPQADGKAIATGTGYNSTSIVAGTGSFIQVTTYDKFGNKYGACSGANYWCYNISVPIINSFYTSCVSTCNNGVYNFNLNITQAGTFPVIVSGRASKTNVSNTPGSSVIIPSSLYAPNTPIYYPTGVSLVVGEPLSFPIFATDAFGNDIATCSPLISSSNWTVFVYMINNPNINTTGVVPTQDCLSGTYYAQFKLFHKGSYYLIINYNGVPLKNSPYPIELVNGQVSTYSYAQGNGVNINTPSVAGFIATFTIYSVNQYNVTITDPDICVQQSIWNITFNPPLTAFPSNNQWVVGPCNSDATYTVYYNGTVAQIVNINIFLGNSSIISNPYQGQIIPAQPVPQYTTVTNLLSNTSDHGSFNLFGKDKWGNNATYTGTNGFVVSLSPPCASSYVNCELVSSSVQCNYSVGEGGIYCVKISYNGYSISIPESRIQITDGTACSNNTNAYFTNETSSLSCNQRGYCFADLPQNSTTTFSCACFQDWTGTTCEKQVPTKYMSLGLAIGLIVAIAIILFIIGLLIGFFIARNRGHRHSRLLESGSS